MVIMLPTPTPTEALVIYIGLLCFLQSLHPFQLWRLWQNLDYNGERKNQSACWNQTNGYQSKGQRRIMKGNETLLLVITKCPLETRAGHCVSLCPSPPVRERLWHLVRGLEEQPEFLGRTVLNTSQLCLLELLRCEDKVWQQAWLSPYTVAMTSMWHTKRLCAEDVLCVSRSLLESVQFWSGMCSK